MEDASFSPPRSISPHRGRVRPPLPPPAHAARLKSQGAEAGRRGNFGSACQEPRQGGRATRYPRLGPEGGDKQGFGRHLAALSCKYGMDSQQCASRSEAEAILLINLWCTSKSDIL